MTRASGLDVAVGRVGRPGARARWTAIAWAVVIVAVVAPAVERRFVGEAPTPRVAIVGPHADPGPMASAPPRRAPHAATPRGRMSGEDGLMGGLTFDVKQPYRRVLWWPVGRLGWQTNPAQS